nr:hypothetical protein [Verrucomicrobiota bacterium JB025]
MELLLPRMGAGELRRVAGMAAVGVLVAAGFGVVHDQLTFSISPGYFRELKFGQFGWIGADWPERVKVAAVGVAGTWWVGLVAGWFLGRWLVGRTGGKECWVWFAGCQGWMLAGAVMGGGCGWFAGPWVYGRTAGWWELLATLEVDAAAYTRVAGIHLGAYAGALAGLAGGVAWCWRK